MQRQFFKRPVNIIKNFQFLGQNLKGVGMSPYILASKYKHIPQIVPYEFPMISEGIEYDKMYLCMEQNYLTYEMNKYSLDNYHRVINFGGDHSIATGSVKASLDKYGDELHIIWIDAHADANTRKDSTSKNLHGMPVNMLLDICEHNVEWLKVDPLKPTQITYIGLRDLDPYEHGLLHYYNIEHYSMRDLEKLPLDFVLKLLKNKYENKKIHLSIDVDSLDPVFMPCTGTPVPNGLTMNEMYNIIRTFGEQIINVDIVELNLELGDEYDKKNSYNGTIGIIDSLLRIFMSKN